MMRRAGSNRSTIRSARKCYLCARNELSPMCPEWTGRNWRRRPDLNRGWRFCRPLPYHLATAPIRTGESEEGFYRGSFVSSFAKIGLPTVARVLKQFGPPALARNYCELRWATLACITERRLERETGFEPATSTL